MFIHGLGNYEAMQQDIDLVFRRKICNYAHFDKIVSTSYVKFLEASKAGLRLLETYKNQETGTTKHTRSDDVFMNLSSCLIKSIRCSNSMFQQECIFEDKNSSFYLLPMPNDAVLDSLLYSLVDDIEIDSDTNAKNIKEKV